MAVNLLMVELKTTCFPKFCPMSGPLLKNKKKGRVRYKKWHTYGLSHAMIANKPWLRYGIYGLDMQHAVLFDGLEEYTPQQGPSQPVSTHEGSTKGEKNVCFVPE